MTRAEVFLKQLHQDFPNNEFGYKPVVNSDKLDVIVNGKATGYFIFGPHEITHHTSLIYNNFSILKLLVVI